MFESGFKFYFLQWKKKTMEKSLLLSLIIKKIKKKPQSPHALGNVTVIVPLPLVWKPLVEFYFYPLPTQQLQKCHMKKNTETPGSNIFFSFLLI